MSMTDPGVAGNLDLRVFAYAVVEKANLYVAVMDALVASKERFTLQLRPWEVARHLADVSVEDVAAALEALEGWGNVTKFYDTAAPGNRPPGRSSATGTELKPLRGPVPDASW